MGQTSTGTVRMSAAVAILAVLGLLLSLFTTVRPVQADDISGQISIFKIMCEAIGKQDTCIKGRDTSLDNYKIDFQVFAGSATTGTVLQTITVTLSENANGIGNQGNGSQGHADGQARVLSDTPGANVYTACEVPTAYLGESLATATATVLLSPYPRPNAGGGGSTGGQQEQNTQNCIKVELTGGKAELKFLNLRLDRAAKTGMKFNDLDADGVKDEGEPGLADWVIYADLNGNSMLEANEPSDTTDASGTYSIPLDPGTYTFREVQKTGWTCSFPAPCSYTETLASGETSLDNDFGNWTTASKTGMKFNNLDGDAVKDAGELGLSGWVIYADLNGNSVRDGTEPFATTGTDGTYSITGLRPSTYTFREVQQTGWTCTFPTTTCAHTETLTSGQTSANNDFGNTAIVVQLVTPTLVIDKVANAEVITINGTTATPSTITWTLTYTLTNGPVTGAVITDTLPTGLNYVAGSATPAAGFSLSADGRTLTWNFATLSTSGSVSFQTSVNVATISRTAPTVNVATIDSNQTNPDTGQDQVTVTVVTTVQGGNPTPSPTPVVREATQAASVPNTAMDGPMNQLPVVFLALLTLGSLGYLGRRNLIGIRNRR